MRDPSWFGCTGGGPCAAPVSAATIRIVPCSKTAIDRRVAGNQRNVEGMVRPTRLLTCRSLQREGPPVEFQTLSHRLPFSRVVPQSLFKATEGIMSSKIKTIFHIFFF